MLLRVTMKEETFLSPQSFKVEVYWTMIWGRKLERSTELKKSWISRIRASVEKEGLSLSTVISQISPNPLPRLNSFRREDAIHEIPR